MPRYEVAEKTLRIRLASDPTAEVWGPGELDFWEETRIRSRSQRTEVNPISGDGLTIVDSAVLEYELFHSWLEHPDANWNLFDANDQPYERTRPQIDKLFRGIRGKRDRNEIIRRLAREFFPEMVLGASDQPGEGEEGNDGTATPSADQASGTSSSDPSSPSSPTPIRPADGTEPELVNSGSMTTPGDNSFPPG